MAAGDAFFYTGYRTGVLASLSASDGDALLLTDIGDSRNDVYYEYWDTSGGYAADWYFSPPGGSATGSKYFGHNGFGAAEDKFITITSGIRLRWIGVDAEYDPVASYFWMTGIYTGKSLVT